MCHSDHVVSNDEYIKHQRFNKIMVEIGRSWKLCSMENITYNYFYILIANTKRYWQKTHWVATSIFSAAYFATTRAPHPWTEANQPYTRNQG